MSKKGALLPLCVDFDGTLVACETHRFAFKVLRQKNFKLACFFLLRLLFRGRLAAKNFAAFHVFHKKNALFALHKKVEDIFAPRPLLLAWLWREKKKGRKLVLVTGAPFLLRKMLQKKYPFFDRIITSSPSVNCVGRAKAARLTKLFGHKGFGYVGNSFQDMAALRCAQKAYLVSKKRTMHSVARFLLPNVTVSKDGAFS